MHLHIVFIFLTGLCCVHVDKLPREHMLQLKTTKHTDYCHFKNYNLCSCSCKKKKVID